MIIEFPGVLHQYISLYPDASPTYMAMLIIRRICLAGQGVYWYLLVLAEATLVAGALVIWKKERLLYSLAWICSWLCICGGYFMAIFG